MKARANIVIAILFPLVGFSQLSDITEKITENKGNLNAYIHEPAKKTTKQVPLVLVLHGCNQDADEIARSSGWNELADNLGFYVLYPEQRGVNNMIKCFNWFLENDQEKDKGEIASIHEMVQYAVSTYQIDESRIYIYGVSAGAAMSVNYMACYPNTIKSGAILAGTAYKQVDSPMKSFSEMREPTVFSDENLRQKIYSQDSLYKGAFPQLIIIHGNDDKVVNYGNGEVLLKQWKTVTKVVSESTKNVNINVNSPKITRTDYKDSKNNSVIIFYTADKWGHYLMIDPGPSPKQGGEVTKYAKDGDFFSTYELAKDWNLVP
ncbi:extracellular catalytic domain type 1 short-chain-length polyhydroxyalkanoate depolymerase [Fluviicola taffensis]|uniref:Esterase, PHB depolymerase family n=1 Tax=Fluviicola taffensis (strain DSM 16823 / NCIMB 13979 / RW262) TaxID=755732 RepID=F2IE28_FLUTR|nr:PHB depolymerase family esterase [Fluviicola taffensis]AEA45592.1 esterase, PHB depolymerase family [Fluviicola taffensis DSM 16823]